MLCFSPITAEDYKAFHVRVVKDYADAQVKAGNWSKDIAQALAEESFHKQLPNGRSSENNEILTIVHSTMGTIGTLWLQTRRQPLPNSIHVLDIFIKQEKRQQGFGEATMKKLEEMALERACPAITLHVFEHNIPARQLYLKLGFKDYPAGMVKYLRKP